MSAPLVTPTDVVRREKRRRRVEMYLREGMTQAQAVRAAVAIELIQQARDKKAAAAAAAAGAVETSKPSPILYKDSAVDRVAARIKDFIVSRSSEQAHKIAVETAQTTEREKRAKE
jgi:hypothetical protein